LSSSFEIRFSGTPIWSRQIAYASSSVGWTVA
jgi:hypothetical protein